MKRMPYSLASVGIAALVIIGATARVSWANDDLIRVGLTGYGGASKTVVVRATVGRICLRTLSSPSQNTSSTVPKLEAANWTLEAGESGLTARQEDGSVTDAGSTVVVESSISTAFVAIDCPNKVSRQYRGALEIGLKNGGLQIVNVVPVEDYLMGVVPVEMPESYPEEALKAQAIAARTYALKNRKKHAAQGYDLCDTSHCQSYGGMLVEKPKCTSAVASTRGIVLTHNKQLASVLYSADCGGATQNSSEVYSSTNAPYLCGVTEPAEIVHTTWEVSFVAQDLADKLKCAGIKEAEGLSSIAVAKSGSSGRALMVEVLGSAGSTTVTGEKLRRALGLKSTLFSIETLPDGTITMKGKGHGHGVGMCQTGAKALALPPFDCTYDKILAHYFPGTELLLPGGPTPVCVAGSDSLMVK